MIETGRFRLRPFEASDAKAFASLNGDPDVMRHFPAIIDRDASNVLLAAFTDKWRENGICFGAIEHKTKGLIGMCGLNHVTFAATFTPAVEIGWRLAKSTWGQGYASEAAMAWLNYGFTEMNLDEIVAFTAKSNQASLALMRRLGMRLDRRDEFSHPNLKADSPLNPMALGRISRREFLAQ